MRSYVIKGLRSLRDEGLNTTLRRVRGLIRRRAAAQAKSRSPDTVWDHSFSFKNEEGAVISRRPHITSDYSIRVPLPTPFLLEDSGAIAIIIHAFYVDLFPEIVQYLTNIEQSKFIYISTDTREKSLALEAILAQAGHRDFEIRIFPNRGRDIAPKIVGFSDVYAKHSLFLHLHTKKSPHSGGLKHWRSFLLQGLVGSKEIVRSNIHLLRAARVGIVFPQHYLPLRGSLNWGYDYETAQVMLRKIGREINKDQVLEFPSGSMFWGRSAALKDLLAINLDFDDFPAEAGQVDGTLAHAIERTYLHFVEHAGFTWLKTNNVDNYPFPETVLSFNENAISKVFRPLLEEPGRANLCLPRTVPELRPIRHALENSKVERLNLIVPSVNPSSLFGGITTAIKVFVELVNEAPLLEARIIVTDASPEPGAVEAVKRKYFPSLDITVVDQFEREVALDLRYTDIFMSTAWWTEILRRDIVRFQKNYFNVEAKGIYLIQDYEPNFQNWSSKWAMAESTYGSLENTVAIINSEELFNFFKARYSITNPLCMPYRRNESVFRNVVAKPRAKVILCYARPSVARNCFEILVDGLAIWQQRNPLVASEWRVLLVGEAFPRDWAHPLQNFEVLGKVELSDYGDLLSESSIGISLMVSPHPSYPPLEMAEAGIVTISNNYEGKQIGVRSSNILPIDQLTPDAVAASLEKARERLSNTPPAMTQIADIPYDGRPYSPQEVISFILT